MREMAHNRMIRKLAPHDKEKQIMRTVLLAIGTVVAFGAVITVWAEENEEKKSSFWMKRKLAFSQNILSALAKEEFDAISQNATAMKGLNQIESFVRRKPAGYRRQLDLFQFSVNELIRTSQQQNIDGATLAFTQMTVSCVHCHKQLRKSQSNEAR